MRKPIAAFLSFVLVFMSITVTGCNQAQVVAAVQNAVNGLSAAQHFIPDAKILAQDIAPLDPALAALITEYAGVADTDLTQLIKIGKAYLAAPSATGLQGFLNAVDALAGSVDEKVLAAGHIVDPATQARVLKLIAEFSLAIHGVVFIIEAVASSAQKKAMPKSANRVPFDQVRPYLKPYVAAEREQLKAMGYDADAAMKAVGF